MQRCLELARSGAGNVAPNPMVGAVLVHNDRVIGEGYHQQYGEAHAEVNCVNNVKEEDRQLIDKSTLYVSLEPCSHFGKTPPCANLIVKHKIPKVVIGCKDNYDEVNGKGIEKLKANNIEVVTGVLEDEAIALNKRFFTYHKKNRPYMILKWAQSSNGKIGGDEKRILISNAITNRLVHKWRSEEAAILVGKITAQKDDPALTTRLWKGKNPVRIVVDRNLELPTSLQLFDNTIPTIVFNSIKEEQVNNLSYYKANTLNNMLNVLYNLRIQSVLIEGGAKLLQSFIDEDLWDEARVITNTALQIDKGTDAPILQNEILNETTLLLTDSIGYYTNGR